MDNSVFPTPTGQLADRYETPAIVDLGTLEELTNGTLFVEGPDVNIIGNLGGSPS